MKQKHMFWEMNKIEEISELDVVSLHLGCRPYATSVANTSRFKDLTFH